MVVCWSLTNTPGNGDLTLDDDGLEETQSLRILGVTLDCKLTFEANLREVVSKAVRSLGDLRRAGKLFDYSRVCTGFVQNGVSWASVDVVCGVSFRFAG